MASARACIVYLWLFVVVFLEISDVEGRRGGGGSRSSSRSSRSHSFSSSRAARTYTSVALTGRVLGSSKYTMLNWRTAALAGYIYGGPRYIRLHSHRHDMPPICTNDYEKSPEGRIYGYFICPKENETETYIYCCGPSKREYCCDREMAQKYVSRKSGLSIGDIFGIVFTVGFVCVLSFICFKKRKQAGVIIRRYVRRDGGVKPPADNPDNQTAPLNGPAPAYDGLTPSMPPPSYDAVASHPSYDGVSGLPYGPPQPQPPPNIDEKPGLPAPSIGDAAQPYWSPYPPQGADTPYPYPHEPSAASAPYPPPSEPSYSLSNEPPYPNPGMAPYPPSDGAPYPTTGGSPYPTTGGSPYPTTGGAPYPTTGGAPYPTTGGSAYPQPGGSAYPSYSSPNSDSLPGGAK